MELNVYSLFVVFLLSLFVQMSIEFTCGDLHCLNDECLDDGTCLQGCMEGFVADTEGRCVNGCTEKCSVCVDGMCKACHRGHYGVRCKLSCEGCKNGSCEQTDGKCVNGCSQGFTNPPFCNITHEDNTQLQKEKQLKEEEKMRGFFIWIAGAITLSVLSAIGIMIILIVLERSKSQKEPATEHLYQEERYSTEIV